MAHQSRGKQNGAPGRSTRVTVLEAARAPEVSGPVSGAAPRKRPGAAHPPSRRGAHTAALSRQTREANGTSPPDQSGMELAHSPSRLVGVQKGDAARRARPVPGLRGSHRNRYNRAQKVHTEEEGSSSPDRGEAVRRSPLPTPEYQTHGHWRRGCLWPKEGAVNRHPASQPEAHTDTGASRGRSRSPASHWPPRGLSLTEGYTRQSPPSRRVFVHPSFLICRRLRRLFTGKGHGRRRAWSRTDSGGHPGLASHAASQQGHDRNWPTRHCPSRGLRRASAGHHGHSHVRAATINQSSPRRLRATGRLAPVTRAGGRFAHAVA